MSAKLTTFRNLEIRRNWSWRHLRRNILL